jgi:hypothetical protein
MCPLQAFFQLQKFFPVAPTDPFLSHRSANGLYIVTQAQIRAVFKKNVFNICLFTGRLAFTPSGGLVHPWLSHPYIDAGARDASVPRLFPAVFGAL